MINRRKLTIIAPALGRYRLLIIVDEQDATDSAPIG